MPTVISPQNMSGWHLSCYVGTHNQKKYLEYLQCTFSQIIKKNSSSKVRKLRFLCKRRRTTSAWKSLVRSARRLVGISEEFDKLWTSHAGAFGSLHFTRRWEIGGEKKKQLFLTFESNPSKLIWSSLCFYYLVRKPKILSFNTVVHLQVQL